MSNEFNTLIKLGKSAPVFLVLQLAEIERNAFMAHVSPKVVPPRFFNQLTKR